MAHLRNSFHDFLLSRDLWMHCSLNSFFHASVYGWYPCICSSLWFGMLFCPLGNGIHNCCNICGYAHRRSEQRAYWKSEWRRIHEVRWNLRYTVYQIKEALLPGGASFLCNKKVILILYAFTLFILIIDLR